MLNWLAFHFLLELVSAARQITQNPSANGIAHPTTLSYPSKSQRAWLAICGRVDYGAAGFTSKLAVGAGVTDCEADAAEDMRLFQPAGTLS